MTAPSTDQAGVRQTIRALRNAKHTIFAVEDGAGEIHSFGPNASEDDLIAEVMSCDDGYLMVLLPDGQEGHVYFVFGNEPFEVICDHSISLSPVLDPLTERWDPDTDD